MTRIIIFSLPFLLTMIVPPVAGAADSHSITVESLDALARSVGIDADGLSREAGDRKLKIAVLDNGFRGFKTARGETIPKSTHLRTGPIAVDPKSEEAHGLKMAEILSNLLDRTGASYELHLFQAFGYSNFKAATEAVIREKFDLVLYSQVWEYSGNDDGRGFINKLVSNVTAKGIIWVNATGNFAQSLYRTAVVGQPGEFVSLPAVTTDKGLRIRCKPLETDDEKAGVCRLRLVLAWNSFSDDIAAGTDKDLDLVLTDAKDRIVSAAELRQVKEAHSGDSGTSLYPRETIEIEIKKGLYFARVKMISANFGDQDRLRITASGAGIELLDRTDGETLMAPADNPTVIPIGAMDSARSSYNRNRIRPDRAVSLIETEEGATFKGSSQASAAFAARIAFELTRRDDLYRDAILHIIRGGQERLAAPELVTDHPRVIAITPTTRTCYRYQVQPIPGPHIRKMLRDGGVVVETTTGIKMFIDENPFDRAERLGLQVASPDQRSNSLMLVADSTGLYAMSTANRERLPADAIEIARTPEGAQFCRFR